MTATRHIGGSVLPSNNLRILQPVPTPFGILQVRPLPDLDTHGLFLAHDRGESCLVMHPNGHSCYELASRMISGDQDRILKQIRYIVACGGMAMGENFILGHVAEPAHAAEAEDAAPVSARGP